MVDHATGIRCRHSLLSSWACAIASPVLLDSAPQWWPAFAAVFTLPQYALCRASALWRGWRAETRQDQTRPDRSKAKQSKRKHGPARQSEARRGQAKQSEARPSQTTEKDINNNKKGKKKQWKRGKDQKGGEQRRVAKGQEGKEEERRRNNLENTYNKTNMANNTKIYMT